MEDEWPSDFEKQVAGIEVILKGWIQNLSRNAAGEGITLEPAVIAQALDNLLEEYNDLVTGNVDDIDQYLQEWMNRGGSD